MSEMSVVESRLAALGMNMPAPPRPLAYTGTIGLELDVAAAQNAVRLAVLNGLSAARAHLGNLEAIRKVVRLAIYQRTTAEFADHAKVADAASDLLHGLFGAEAAHTRMVFGVCSLPASMPVEVDLVFEVAEAEAYALKLGGWLPFARQWVHR